MQGTLAYFFSHFLAQDNPLPALWGPGSRWDYF